MAAAQNCLKKQLDSEIKSFQAYLELKRDYADRFDPEQLDQLNEDVEKARRAVEVAWLALLRSR